MWTGRCSPSSIAPGRVLPEDANDVDGDREYQLERAQVIEKGFTAEHETEFCGIKPELSPKAALCHAAQVGDISVSPDFTPAGTPLLVRRRRPRQPGTSRYDSNVKARTPRERNSSKENT